MLTELFFPRACLSCRATGHRFLCPACEAAFPAIGPSCARCSRPLPAPAPRCSDCAHDPAFSRARAVATYAGVARDALMTLKFGGERRAAAALAERMASLAPAADVATFVPPSAGLGLGAYNTAEELARAVARLLRMPCRPLLAKVRRTADQASLGRERRRRNLAGAFRSRPVRGRVLLVDDVMTTGATADACARALREAGAEDVGVLTFTRAV
ncbi:MAG TPA: ComF family protein [Actinomycetota bacterium]